MASREPVDTARLEPRAERAQNVKQTVLQEAAALFAEHGFDGVSLDEVAAQAGVKRTLILYHFSSKIGLWMHAVQFIADRFDARLAERLAAIRPSNDADRLRGLIRASLEALTEVPSYGRVLVREGCVAGPRVDWLARCFSPPTLRFDDPAFARRLNHTLMRDVMIGAILTATTLGPLLEASLSATAGERRRGIRPLSVQSREELVELLVTMAAPPGGGS